VTPSQTVVQALQRRASVSPVCQLQLIVRHRLALLHISLRNFGPIQNIEWKAQAVLFNDFAIQ
jgi:hypothetical protein